MIKHLAPFCLTFVVLVPLAAAQEEPKTHPRVKVHAKPGPRAAGAVDSDWTAFLGPTHDGICKETKLLKSWPAEGLKLLWTMGSGESYASPAIKGDRLVYTCRLGPREEVVCLHPETGAHYWTFKSPTGYRDRYGFGGGPRVSPVIDGDRVYAYGAECKLHCLDLKTGKVIWKRDLAKEHELKQQFFGNSANPVVLGDLLIINLGAPGGPCVVGLDKKTGKQVWGAGKKWGPSYASPVPATIHGKQRVLVMGGGDSDPPHGGLLCIDPANGKVDFRVPWRSTEYSSVNAACPVVIGDSVFITASYNTGGAMISIDASFKPKIAWKASKFGSHWSTPVHHDGHIYGFDGQHMKNCALVCYEAKTGKELWREKLRWKEKEGKREVDMGVLRASLIWADGQFLCLGELGHLLWLDLSPKGAKVTARTRLFMAPQTWSPPVISRGLLYVCQNHRGPSTPPRLCCYDLRGK